LLFTCLFIAAQLSAQKINYGNNPSAGHYLAMADSTKIYYEVYGKGRPVVLLHGALYGDISEFSGIIPVLSKKFRVIAIELRGHAKSEIGHQPFTYTLLADDALTIIQHLTKDSVILIGFSSGAVTALTLTIAHPGLVRKLVYAGGNLSPQDTRPEMLESQKTVTGDSIVHDNPGFVQERKRLMPQPERWNEFITYLKNAWLTLPPADSTQLRKIACPVLIVGGDRDQVNGIESFLKQYQLIPNSSLAIIPNSDHIIFHNRPDLMERLIMAFVE